MPAHFGFIMGALANLHYVKMNGLGNEIVIVDLRRTPRPIAAEEARAAARREPYDQLMALYPARGGPTRQYGFTTTTARRPALAAMACGASLRWSAPRPASAR